MERSPMKRATHCFTTVLIKIWSLAKTNCSVSCLPNASKHLDQRKNMNGDTVLHLAMKNKKISIFNTIIERFNRFGGAVYLWLNKILQAKNKAENTFISLAIKTGIPDEEIIQMMNKLSYRQKRILCDIVDGDDNTILHLASQYNRHTLICYLTDKTVQETRRNKSGFTAVHLASMQQETQTLTVLYMALSPRGKIDINERTAENDTPLHLAMKKKNVDMVLQLVKLGGDLGAQDNNGNTPLHDLIQLLHVETETEDDNTVSDFTRVWDALVAASVEWFCKKMEKSVPDEESQDFILFKRDAVHILRSEISNKEGLTALEYAATFGLAGCVLVMITQENIFVRQVGTRKRFDDNSAIGFNNERLRLEEGRKGRDKFRT